MSSTQLLKLSCPPRHGSVPEPVCTNPVRRAEGVGGAVVDARVGDQQIALAVGGDQSDELSKGGRRNASALPLGQDAPSRFVRGNALVIGLPPADAAGRRAVDVDAEHVRFAGRIQPEVAFMALAQLFGRLRATQVAGHLGRIAELEQGMILCAPASECDLRVLGCAHGSPLSIGPPTPATTTDVIGSPAIGPVAVGRAQCPRPTPPDRVVHIVQRTLRRLVGVLPS